MARSKSITVTEEQPQENLANDRLKAFLKDNK